MGLKLVLHDLNFYPRFFKCKQYKINYKSVNRYAKYMLTILCSECKSKLFKYKKVGQGKILRCHKKRISRIYDCDFDDQGICCKCGQRIGIDKGSYYKMNPRAFTYTGTKDRK